MVSWHNHNIVIDCGPDFRQQMLRHKVSKIDGILFTHEHADHTAGIDDIRPFFFRQGDIPIYAHERVVSSLKKRFDYIFADENRYPGAPAVAVHTIDKHTPFKIDDVVVVPIEALHNRLPVLGFRMNDFTYLTDVKSVAQKEIGKIMGSKILVVNALREEPHHSHFNLREALAFVEKVKPETAYFTHISHLLGFHDVVERTLPKNVHLAYDNMIVDL